MEPAEQPLDPSLVGPEEKLIDATSSPHLVREQYRSLTILVPVLFIYGVCVVKAFGTDWGVI